MITIVNKSNVSFDKLDHEIDFWRQEEDNNRIGGGLGVGTLDLSAIIHDDRDNDEPSALLLASGLHPHKSPPYHFYRDDQEKSNVFDLQSLWLNQNNNLCDSHVVLTDKRSEQLTRQVSSSAAPHDDEFEEDDNSLPFISKTSFE